jgi:hypothetical protein
MTCRQDIARDRTVQGVGVISGSAMSHTTFWTVAGPIIIIVGLALAVRGWRGRAR